MKLFVGRCPDTVTTDDLREYFGKFGSLSDVYIPKPFKNFAFITYACSDDGKEVIAGNHQLGVSWNGRGLGPVHKIRLIYNS